MKTVHIIYKRLSNGKYLDDYILINVENFTELKIRLQETLRAFIVSMKNRANEDFNEEKFNSYKGDECIYVEIDREAYMQVEMSKKELSIILKFVNHDDTVTSILQFKLRTKTFAELKQRITAVYEGVIVSIQKQDQQFVTEENYNDLQDNEILTVKLNRDALMGVGSLLAPVLESFHRRLSILESRY